MNNLVVCVETNHTERLLLTARFEYLNRPPPQFVTHKDAFDVLSAIIEHGLSPIALISLRPMEDEHLQLPVRIHALCAASSGACAYAAALTCLSKPAHISELRAQGFDEVLVKPYSVLDLRRVLDAPLLGDIYGSPPHIAIA